MFCHIGACLESKQNKNPYIKSGMKIQFAKLFTKNKTVKLTA